MEFLPKTGVCGTLYLYCQPQGDWAVVTWDGTKYSQHGTRRSLDEIRKFARTLIWADGWPVVEHVAPTRQMNPCVRVEFEFRDGHTQRLTGDAAEAWLKNVDSILIASSVRSGAPKMDSHPWQYSQKKEGTNDS